MPVSRGRLRPLLRVRGALRNTEDLRQQIQQLLRFMGWNSVGCSLVMVGRSRCGNDHGNVGTDLPNLRDQRKVVQHRGMNENSVHSWKAAKQLQAGRRVVRGNHVVFGCFHNQFARGDPFRLFGFDHKDDKRDGSGRARSFHVSGQFTGGPRIWDKKKRLCARV